MSDEKPADATTPETAQEAEHLRAKVGVKDKGKVVHTAFDEPMSGSVADIADGDA